jgi:hypothetical protein
MALALAFVLATGGAARAQDEDEEEESPPPDEESPPPQEEEAPPADRADGSYQGVAPGEGAPDGRRPRRGRTPLVTWLGFQPQPGGGARVFVQLDREVPHAQQVQDGTLFISLEGAKVAHHNMRRFLDTRFFDSAVDRVAIEKPRRRPGSRRRHARGLELVIRFKNPAEAREAAAAMRADSRPADSRPPVPNLPCPALSQDLVQDLLRVERRVLGLGEDLRREAFDGRLRRAPRVRRELRLAAHAAQELIGRPSALARHLREEQAALAAAGDGETVHADLDLSRLADDEAVAEHGHFDDDRIDLVGAERRKARIARGGGDRHLLDRAIERRVLRLRADAAAQIVAVSQRHERARKGEEAPPVRSPGRDASGAEELAQGRPRDAQDLPLLIRPRARNRTPSPPRADRTWRLGVSLARTSATGPLRSSWSAVP